MFEFNRALETLLTFRLIFIVAALGHYLPISIGQLDVAIVGYMAVGAYTSAVLTRNFGVHIGPALILGGLLATIFALVLDYTAARVKLKGFAFAIVSLGFAEIVRVLLINFDYTGGSLGFRQIQPYTTFPIALGILVLIVVFFLLLNRSYLGRALHAIRDDEVAAEAMGINVLATKLFAFGAGAFIGGVAGGLYAHYALYLEPSQFGFARLIEIQLPIVFGGLETFWGAIFGVAFLGLLPEVLRPLSAFRLIFYAVLTIVVVITRPQGVITRQMIDTFGGWCARLGRRLGLGGGARRPAPETPGPRPE